MSEIYQLDELDRGILNALMDNARTPYAELAKVFTVSPGTIHVRVEKMKQAGIITGAHITVNPKQLGYDVCCFIGIILKSAKDYPSALKKLESIDPPINALSHKCLVRFALKRNSKATPRKIRAITMRIIGKYSADKTAE